jgi:hypothetical protein
MGARRWLLVVLVAAAAFAIAFVVASRDEDGEDEVRTELDLDALDALAPAARELVTLADRGSRVPHHASYQQPDGPTFEVWTDGEQIREETVLPDGERRLLLRTEDEAVECVEAEGGWDCTEPSAPGSGVQGRVEQLTADLAGAEVTARSATVAEVDVRCFDVAVAEDEALEICLTAEGVLARLAAGGDRLELVELDDDVDEDDFQVPAEA